MADSLHLGYLIDEEDRKFLLTGDAGNFSAPGDFVPPPTLSFRDKLKTENQSSMSSCVGHGGSSGMEALQWMASGTKIQMSRMACYLISQRYSGIRGDRGATISGCVKGLNEVGCPLEETYPYPNPVRYTDNLPQSVKVAAGKYKILGFKRITNGYQGVLEWITSGKGPVINGITWYERLANNRSGQVDTGDLRGRSLGGHCTLFVGYQGDRDARGNLKIDMLNSHGTGWGQGGWSQWTSDAIDRIASEGNTELIGITDITGFDEQRLWNITSIV